MRTTLRRRVAAALAGTALAGALALAPATPAFADTPCPAGVFTQVDFYVNPLWPVTPRIQVSGTPSFSYRWYGTAFPFFYESGLIFGTFTDVLIPPGVGTTLEIRCTTNGRFTH